LFQIVIIQRIIVCFLLIIDTILNTFEIFTFIVIFETGIYSLLIMSEIIVRKARREDCEAIRGLIQV